MTRRRVAAILALLVGAATVVFAVAVAVAHFPNAVTVLACLALAVASGWYGFRRRGVRRIAGLAAALVLVAGALVLLVAQGSLVDNVLVLAGAALAIGAAATAFTTRAA